LLRSNPGNVGVQRYSFDTDRHETMIYSTNFATLSIISPLTVYI
jgi:hypothetical protein